MWGDGQAAAADGSQIDTWENNLLAETSIRYGGFGGIAYRLISDTYIALFSHFIPCGVWEAVYIIDGLLANDSTSSPTRSTRIPRASRCRSSGSRRCWGSSCCRGYGTGTT